MSLQERRKKSAKEIVRIVVSFLVGIFTGILSILLCNRRTTTENRVRDESITDNKQRTVDNNNRANESIDGIESTIADIRGQKIEVEDDSVSESWNNLELFDNNGSD